MESNVSLEKRKLRNRLSQRAFRRRQAEMIKDLRHRADSRSKPTSETVDALQTENSRLRQQLIHVQSKLARLITTMQHLSESTSLTLGGSVQGTAADTDENAACGTSSESSEIRPWTVDSVGAAGPVIHADPINELNPATDSQTTDDATIVGNISQEQFGIVNDFLDLSPPANSQCGFEPASTGDFNITAQIPNIWSFEYQMGPQMYLDLILTSQSSELSISQLGVETNSPFSDHIQVLHRLLKRKMELSQPKVQQPSQFFYQQVINVLSLFNSLNRPGLMAWYAKTKFYHIADLTAWQIHPCLETYNRLSRQYQPTPTQLRHQHPNVIDWIPFSSIRDQLISRHAANPKIDQIFCDVVSSYVVETQMSDLVMDAPATLCYIRVTDLIANIPPMMQRNGKHTPALLPAPQVATLFSSADYSAAVFELLHMDQGASCYKIDPALFGKYPELYCHDYDIVAKGIPLKPETQPILSCPGRLDEKTFDTYVNFIQFSFNAPFVK